MIQFGVLGSLEIRRDGMGVELTSARLRRVLAVLLTHANQVVSSDRLLEWGWPDGWPSGAEATLRTTVSRLRSVVEPDRRRAESARLRTEPPGYVLHVDADEVDAERFQLQVTDALRRLAVGDALEACRLLDLALELWRGPAYAEFADEEWARPIAVRLEELRLSALDARAEAMLACGLHAEVVGQLEALIDQHPHREGLRAHHMLALYRAGRQAEALRAYQAYRRMLAEESGLEPSNELKRLDARIAVRDSALDLSVALGRPLRSYRLLNRIGEGPWGVVYRATQPSSGRDVAVKALRSDVSNNPELIRNFAFDTQAVLALTHPHIAELYDAWRDPGGAFLVSRFFERGNAETALRNGPMTAEAAARIVGQLAGALAHAHARGVVHGRVGLTNVLFDEHGAAYIADFVSGPPSGGHHAVDNLAPEQTHGGRPTPAADQYALGRVAWSLFAGSREADGDLSAAVLDVLRTATATNPRSRFEHLADFVDALGAAVGGGRPSLRVAHTTALTTNPYKGLRTFQEADADDFFGRKRLVGDMLARLARPGSAGRFIVLVGPSGSGKSSTVRAGLIPELRRGAVDGSDRWFIATMVPGTDPFAELETALLRIAVNTPAKLAEQLSLDARAFGRTLSRVLPDETAELLLLIDQFEELFTLTSDEVVRAQFLDGLMTAIGDAHSSVRVVATLRADFYDRPLRIQRLAELLPAHQLTIAPMSAAELQQAIGEPAARRGVVIDPVVVAGMLAELIDREGALPFLQLAMAQLFDNCRGGSITKADYDALGGVTGALATIADAVQARLPADGQALSRHFFCRLVTLGEGVPDTRRRIRRSELPIVESGAALEEVLDRFGNARLLTFDHDPDTREPTVELAHEALITGWPLLQRWIDDDRDVLRAQRHLSAAASAWAAAERDPDELYRGARLAAVAEWTDQRAVELTALEREFVMASLAERDNEHEVERQRVRHQARQNRRLRVLLGCLAVTMAVSLVAGIVAVKQRDDANRAAERAETASANASAQAEAAEHARDGAATQAAQADAARFAAETGRLASAAAAELEEHRSVGLLLAVEAYRREQTPATLGALQTALTGTPDFIGNLVSGHNHWSVAFTPDGSRIVAVSDSGLAVWDTGSQQIVATIEMESVAERRMALSPDGARAAVTTTTGIGIIDLATGSTTATVAAPGPAASFVFHPSRPSLAVGTDDGRVIVWDLDRGTPVWETTAFPSDAGFVGFTPDGEILAGVQTTASGFTNQAIFWDATTGEERGRAGIGRNLKGGFVHPHGDRLLTVAAGKINAWRIPSGEPSPGFVWPNSNDLLFGTAVLPDGKVAAGTSAGDVFIWGEDGAPDRVIPVHDSAIESLAVSPDGRTLAVGSTDSVSLWSLDRRQFLARALPGNGARFVTIDADATRLATTGEIVAPPGQRPHVWDITGDRPHELPLPDTPAPITRAYLTGHLLVTVEGTQRPLTTRIWDARTMTPLGPPMEDVSSSPFGWYFPAASPDDERVAFATVVERAVEVRDVATGARIDLLDDLDQLPTVGNCPLMASLSFDPSGRTLVGSECGGAAVAWDTATFAGRSLTDARDMVNARYSFDGSYIFASTQDGELTIRDARTLQVVGTALGHRGQSFMDGDPRTGVVFSGGTADRTARLWAFESGHPVQIGRPFPSALLAVGASSVLVTRSDDDVVWLWDIRTEQWPALACRAAGRNLSNAEWLQYGPQDEPFRETCPSFD
jgi:DNA-binding SARP family transcriptional activator/WD40 repeat protein